MGKTYRNSEEAVKDKKTINSRRDRNIRRIEKTSKGFKAIVDFIDSTIGDEERGV
jgi:hypothetical protein